MSGGGSKSSSKNQSTQTSQQTSSSYLDPDIKNAIFNRYTQAEGFANGASYQPITGSDIASFQNPYTSQVVDATNADLDRQAAIARQGVASQAVASGAYGGDRATVAASLSDDNYARQKALADATLNQQGFTTALSAAQTQNQQQNQYPLLLQELLNSSLGLAGNPTLSSSQGTSSGQSTGSSNNLGFTLGPKAG